MLLKGRIMVDESRLRLMTGAEMIKRRNRRDLFTRRTFYGSDFVAFGVIKSIVGATIAYIVLIIIIFLSQADEMLTEINISQLISLGFDYINTYVLILIASLVLSVFQHVKLYHYTGKSVREYRNIMKELEEMSGDKNHE